MNWTQWTIPVVLGLAATGLTWTWSPDVALPSQDVEVRTHAPYVLVPAPHAAHHAATLLRYNTTHDHPLGGILDIHAGTFHNGSFSWDGRGWGCLRLPASCPPPGAASQPDVFGPRLADVAGPRVGPGNATVDLTFYLFASSGHLLATNAPRSAWDVYDLHGQFTPFSATTWHLDGTPVPPGARSLPVFRAQAYALLEGTPVGGVQSAVLEQHAYDWLVGPVWATARVDAIH